MKNVYEEQKRIMEEKGVDEYQAWGEIRRIGEKLRAAEEILAAIYNRHYREELTPNDTVKEFIENVGVRKATVLLATLTNNHGWDGRFSPKSREWAKSQKTSWDESSARKFHLYTSIHLACFDQIVRAFMRWLEEDKAKKTEARKAKKEG